MKDKMIKVETAYSDMLRVRNLIRGIDQSTIEEAEQLINELKKHIDECLIKYKEGEDECGK